MVTVATFAGLASDDVARIGDLYRNRRQDPRSATRQRVSDRGRARSVPGQVVAYDAEGRVIGIERTQRSEGPATVIGEPTLRLSVAAPGASMQLRTNRTKEGGECWFVNGTGTASVRTNSCTPKNWTEAPLRIGIAGEPLLFVYGRARTDITRVEAALQRWHEARLRAQPRRIHPREDSAATGHGGSDSARSSASMPLGRSSPDKTSEPRGSLRNQAARKCRELESAFRPSISGECDSGRSADRDRRVGDREVPR